MTYQLVKNPETEQIDSVRYSESGKTIEKIIPFDEDNSQYQEYLEWVAAGNKAKDPAVKDAWQEIRLKRDRLLKESDWTMTTGATIDQAQWAAYREKLRDIPQKYSSHSDVVWPTPPSTKGPNTK